MKPRVLVVDDQTVFLATACRLLTAEGFEVVGTAADGDEAVRCAALLRPDVVLLDVGLPDGDGFSVAERLIRLDPKPAIVLTSSREARDYGGAVGAAPVEGFVAKHELTGARVAALLPR